MISTSPVTNDAEKGYLISILTNESLVNDLIIGDIHAPMNKISDVFKLIEDNEIVSGWSIFHGFKRPIIIFPPEFPQGWPSIRSFMNALRHPEIMLTFPKQYENQNEEKPWSSWDDYTWNHLVTDIAMKFTGDLEILDVSNLPKLRGIGYDERDKLREFFKQEEKGGDYNGIFHPFQMLSDLYVVAEDDDRSIIATAGTHYETPHSVQIGNVYVKDDYRRRGLGRALTSAVTLSILRSYRTPTLFVNNTNTHAIKLYEQIGFEIFNQYEFYHGILK